MSSWTNSEMRWACAGKRGIALVEHTIKSELMSSTLTSPYLGVFAAFAIALAARAQEPFPAPVRFWAAQTSPDAISIN